MSPRPSERAGDEVFAPYMREWRLERDGATIVTHSSRLLPVRNVDGLAAMLKVAFESDENLGHVLMRWWDGDGAAHVLAHNGDALLLERAEGTGSLDAMAREDRDDEATRILCEAIAKLHAPRTAAPDDLIPLEIWFRDLWPAAERHGGLLVRCAETARDLLSAQRDVLPLHGDIHHGNVLDFGARGWLAIDPKRLIGDRAFDYANIFCNPDRAVATAPGRLARQASVISEIADLDRTRLLRWVMAWSGLSAAWRLDDGMGAELDLSVAETAAAELDQASR